MTTVEGGAPLDRGTDPSSLSSSRRHLQQRLALVEARVRDAVGRRRQGDPDPGDRFRGLYITDAEVDELLAAGPRRVAPPPDPESARLFAAVEAEADEMEANGADLRLRRLARAFALDDFDVEILLISLAPDVDPRYERLYAYLHDDVSRRRASAGLALELCANSVVTGVDRRRLDPHSTLVGSGLVLVEEADRPFLTRSLRVPDRVTGHLLGDDTPDPLVAMLMTPTVTAPMGEFAFLAKALQDGCRLCYVREKTGAAGFTLAATALAHAGMPAVAVDLMRLGPGDDPKEVAAAASREALLRGGGLVAGPAEALADRGADAVRSFSEARSPVVLVGTQTWDPRWSREVPVTVDAPLPTVAERGSMWVAALNGGAAAAVDPSHVTLQFRLTPEQVIRAAAAAQRAASAADRSLNHHDLQAGARAQNAAGLERLARRIAPQAQWEDMVLPTDVLVQLREITARARQRDFVLDTWGMGSRSTKGRGITALFAGESGTGKTMSAEVIAGDLGLDLYVIDLSTVVDKYIGETEKNLDRIFSEADRVNGVLLFDEADALFGKRSEVKDARDRYANVEVAYLLQRMELFDGLAILTSNLRANLDEAFTRRIDAIVDFPMPEEEDRLLLWDRHVKPGVPRGDDIDFPFLARAFRMSGGNIRNICLGASFLAAEAGRSVGMFELVRATEREYRKLGRLCVEAEFGPYYSFLSGRNEGSGPSWQRAGEQP